MANELQYYGLLSQTGLTVTASVYNNSGTQVGGTIACLESGSLGIYRGDMPTATAGIYGVRFFDGSTLLGQGEIAWDGSKEILLNLDALISSRESETNAVSRQSALVTEHNATQATLAGLNDFDPTSDTVARVTLVDTTTANTDMRGTNNALLALSYAAPDNSAIAGAVRTELSTELGRVDVDISSRAVAGDAMTLTSGERNSLAVAVEAALLNEGDGQQLIDAIVSAIDNENINQTVLVAAIRSDLERVGGMLDTVPTLAEIEATTVLAKSSDISSLNDVSSAQIVAALQVEANYFKADISSLATSADIAGLNNFDPASDIVARVTLVDTTTTNTDMRGTDGANTLAPNNALLGTVDGNVQNIQSRLPASLVGGRISSSVGAMGVDSITAASIAADAVTKMQTGLETKAQADIRQTALVTEHSATQATLAGLNDFDPASDTVARVTLVDTTTANTDMRGTDGANTLAPNNALISTINTNVTNVQSRLPAALISGRISSAVGSLSNGAITADAIATDAISASKIATDAVTKIQSGLETKVQADARQATLVAEHDATQATLAGLNDISTSDVTASVPSVAQIESALLDDGDGQQLINAITSAVGNINVDEVLLIAAIRSDLERNGGMLESLPTLSEIEASSVIAKTSELDTINDGVKKASLLIPHTDNL